MAFDDQTPNPQRRFLVTTLLAVPFLAACNTVTRPRSTRLEDEVTDAIRTDAFDGRYEIVISRLRVGLEPDGSTPKLRELAKVTVRAVRGQLSVLNISDQASGQNYTDLQGLFSVGGRLRMTMTAGYLTGSVGQSVLSMDDIVGNTLLRGQTITLQPEGFGENYTPVVTVRYLGA
ncbi:hypothetical protein [Jannaschia sp. 2305UL9-9]|uniref:hypothetical protein n=1 Tax=Jannaschia sp. 2305UL9-9 TaxID=3121638 RepID=UPI00352864EC